MRISNINNFYKITFGYDKKLNEELKEALKTYPDRPWANTLSSLNNHCNKLEDTIIKQEKNAGRNVSQFNDYCEMLEELKTLLASHIACTFENLKYPDRESAHYEKQAEKMAKNNLISSDNWRLKLVDAIAWLANDPPESFKKKEQELAKQILDSNKQNINSVAESNKKQSSETINKQVNKPVRLDKIIQKYIPSDKSPKGFCDVVGMEDVKTKLQDGVLKVLKNPEQAKLDYEEYGMNMPEGLLLYGPPGCGKTFITKALAQEAGIPLYTLSLGDVGSHYVNQTSKLINQAFDEIIAHAKETGKPVLLFMDEIDSMAFNRNENTYTEDIKQVGTLLQAMDRAKDSNVFIIGATNKYFLLDPAVKRRFDDKLVVDIPDLETRKGLLKLFLSEIEKGKNLSQDEESITKIAGNLDGYSNDSICKISKEAANFALKRNRDDIKLEDYINAIKETTQEKPDRKEYIDKSNARKSIIGFTNN